MVLLVFSDQIVEIHNDRINKRVQTQHVVVSGDCVFFFCCEIADAAGLLFVFTSFVKRLVDLDAAVSPWS